jgi:5-methylcytosine-specific restriction protein B
VEGLRAEETDSGVTFRLHNGTFKAFCKKAIGKNIVSQEARIPYIFVIDEINRGEISKIFGELFFSIDPGYRGKNGKVMTQYANIQDDKTIFDPELGKGWFYVPRDVYIIGTMNDIDRSVESFDFAMRRRFVWQEITAEESAKNMNLLEETDEDSVLRMKSLNDEIEKTDGLGRHYQVGAAYFMKLKSYKLSDGGYVKLWSLHLNPLLQEYVRALPESKEVLAKLKAAYDLKASAE